MPPRSSFIFSFFFSEGEHSYLYPVKYTAGALHCKIPLPPPPLVFGSRVVQVKFPKLFPFHQTIGTKGSSATLPALVCAPLFSRNAIELLNFGGKKNKKEKNV
jgi:hypothetical protein